MKQARLLLSLWIFLMSLVGMDFIWSSEAHAIPAWARKYDQPCSMCHYPAPPRLNTLGHQFRQAGYRMPDEFNQDINAANVGHYLSVRGRGRYAYANFEDDTKRDTNQFLWNDTTFFYGGPVGKNYAGFAELEWEAEDAIGLVASVSGVWGNSEHFTTLRVGQFHTLSRVGFGGFDRPTGISTPKIRDAELTKGVKFKLGTDQRGVEVAHVFKLPVMPERSRMIVQVTNGVNDAGAGGESDIDAQKDYMLAFEQILDDRASGFTLLYYSGTYHSDPALPATSRFGFQRYGATFAGVLPVGFEIQGGYIQSADDPAAAGADSIDGNAYYVELEQYIAPAELTALARYDFVDPNSDSKSKDDRTTTITVGVVRPLQDWLRLAVEGALKTTEQAAPAEDVTDKSAVVELMLNF
ncbi:MAG: hypothetical protein HY349_02610 [Nitrospirae bacterium]|nr:hypothetical protein [Nitrospirota bacterium]